MSGIMQKNILKINISFQDSVEKVCEKYSCLCVSHVRERISISPQNMSDKRGIDVKSAVKDIYEKQMLYHSNKFKGVPISYGNIKCLQRNALMTDDNFKIFLDIQLDVVVFRPQPGDVLRGVVNKLSPGGHHVGLLVHKFFNVSAMQMDGGDHDVEVGEVREVEVIKLSSHRCTMEIRGKLLPRCAGDVPDYNEGHIHVRNGAYSVIDADEPINKKKNEKLKNKTQDDVDIIKSVLDNDSHTISHDTPIIKKKHKAKRKGKDECENSYHDEHENSYQGNEEDPITLDTDTESITNGELVSKNSFSNFDDTEHRKKKKKDINDVRVDYGCAVEGMDNDKDGDEISKGVFKVPKPVKRKNNLMDAVGRDVENEAIYISGTDVDDVNLDVIRMKKKKRKSSLM